jgi:hypothetical protein
MLDTLGRPALFAILRNRNRADDRRGSKSLERSTEQLTRRPLLIDPQSMPLQASGRSCRSTGMDLPVGGLRVAKGG